MKNRLPVSSISSRAKYATAMSASLAATFEADAAVVYSGPQNISVSVNSSSTAQSTSINIDGLGSVDFILSANASFSSTFSTTSISSSTFSEFTYFGTIGLRQAFPTPNRPLNSGGQLIPLPLGQSVGPTDFMAPTIASNAFAVTGIYATAAGGPNINGLIQPGSGPAFIGIEFESGGNLHYGWMRLRVDDFLIGPGGTSLSVTVTDWAYEDTPDTEIQAGDGAPIPEASSLALLALGATGIGAVRRRKKS